MPVQFSTRQLLLAVTIVALVVGTIAAIGIDEAAVLCLFWPFYAGIAVVTTAPIVWFTRRRVHWYPYEALVLVAPFATWTMLLAVDLVPKSTGNLGELFEASLTIPGLAVARAVCTRWLPNQVCAAAFIAIPCIVVAMLYFLTPLRPE